MNKKIAKLLALGMSIAMVFSLAACGDETANEPTTEAPTTTEATTEAPAVPATGESASVSETGEQPTQTPGETQATGITNPGSDVNAAVALYNDGVSKSGFTTASVQLKWGGSDTTMGDLNGPSLGNGQVAEAFEKSRNYTVTPGSINASDVASVDSKDNGSTITMIFTLKSTSGDASSQYGTGSYPYFITYTDASGLVNEIGKGLFNLNIGLNEKSAEFTIDGGTITATIDKASGKMTALSCHINKETVSSRATVAGIPLIKATIWGSGDISFS